MPASHSSSDHQERGSSREPVVPRPREALLDSIEREGITWEGQVLIVGHDGDIPALLFVTSERFLITDRDTVLLEAPREWLIPAPLRVQESGVRLSVTPEGVVPGPTTTERLLLEVRDGRGPASQMVAILNGRNKVDQFEAEFPDWKTGVGAGRSVALPPLPAFESTQDTASPAHRDTNDPETRGVAPIGKWRPQDDEQPEPARTPFHAPEPDPVEPTSRAARFLTNRSATTDQDSVPVPEEETPANVTSIEEERRERGAGWLAWKTRIAVIAIVVLAGAWFARPYLPDDVSERLPAIMNDEVALNPTAAPEEQLGATDGDGTNGAGTDPEDIMPTEAALGVGGATSAIPDAEEPEASESGGEIPTPTPPDEDTGGTNPGNETFTTNDVSEEPEQTEPETVEEPVETDTEQREGAGEPEPTDPPVVEDPGEQEEPTEPPIVVETPQAPEPTDIPATEAPEVDPTVTAPAPTETPVTPEETAPPATETPNATETPVEPTATEVPATETATATEVPATATEAPATETAAPTEAPDAGTPVATEEVTDEPEPTEPTLEPQAASVSPEEPPAQEFADEGFRYSVEGASTGSTIEELPQIAEVSYGEWVVLAVEGQNWSEDEQVFDMNRFTLLADGEPIQLDVGNSWVASLMDFTPAYGNTDAILWAPGEEHQFVLTFLAPPEAESLVLQAGDQQFDLTSLLANARGLRAMRQEAEPETIDATVVDVINGETIVIEKDGIEQSVRYLGIDIPDGDDCYSQESTEVNRALVEGRNVKIERQATNVDPQGNWVRDVWVEQDDGRFVLVAHQLVQDGAAIADISEPNTRFSSWLRGAEAIAQAEQRGLWGACGSEQDVASQLSTVDVATIDPRGLI